ncbi:hypothetical protein IJ182_00895 [bacterium]|nr:hypothetical protein [bacterium]
MTNIFFSLLIIFLNATNTVIGCETGFACSIEDLSKAEEISQEEFIIEEMTKNSEKEPNSKYFFEKPNEKSNYNDLFFYLNFFMI